MLAPQAANPLKHREFQRSEPRTQLCGKQRLAARALRADDGYAERGSSAGSLASLPIAAQRCGPGSITTASFSSPVSGVWERLRRIREHLTVTLLSAGANQGGKSTLLRSLALAQLLMQCGLFVAAGSCTASAISPITNGRKTRP
jgi:hypothetical protein